MVIVWLVRHGQTAWNVDRRFQGWTDVPLDRTGRDQARQLRSTLESTEFDGIWSSDLSRAVETARLAAGSPVVDRRLREMDFGHIEGAVWDELAPEVREGLKRFEGFVVPGGESTESFKSRVFEFLDELPDGRHLVVAHGGVLGAVGRLCGEEGFPGHAHVMRVDWRARSLLPPESG